MANVLNRTTMVVLESVHTPDYDPSEWIINPDLTALEGIDPTYWVIDGDTVREATQQEIETIDASRLDSVKAAKIMEIDEHTSELIGDGFVYDDDVFSLSIPSQAKMIGTYQVKDDPALVYPIKWNTQDDKKSKNIPNGEALGVFYKTALGTIRWRLDSGTALKDQVRAATTIAEVDAVEDDR